MEAESLVALWTYIVNGQSIAEASDALMHVYADLCNLESVLSVISNPPSDIIRMHAIIGFRKMLKLLFNDNSGQYLPVLHSHTEKIMSQDMPERAATIFSTAVLSVAQEMRYDPIISFFQSFTENSITSQRFVSTSLSLYSILIPNIPPSIPEFAVSQLTSSQGEVRQSAIAFLLALSESDIPMPSFSPSSYLSLVFSHQVLAEEAFSFSRLADALPLDFFSEEDILAICNFAMSAEYDDMLKVAVFSSISAVTQPVIQTALSLSLSLCRSYPDESIYRQPLDVLVNSIELSDFEEIDIMEVLNDCVRELVQMREERAYQVAYCLLESIEPLDGLDFTETVVEGLSTEDVPLVESACQVILHLITDSSIAKSVKESVEPQLVSHLTNDQVLMTYASLIKEASEPPNEPMEVLTNLVQQLTEHPREAVLDALTAVVMSLEDVPSEVFSTCVETLGSLLNMEGSIRGKALLCITALAFVSPLAAVPLLPSLYEVVLDSLQSSEVDLRLLSVKCLFNITQDFPSTIQNPSLVVSLLQKILEEGYDPDTPEGIDADSEEGIEEYRSLCVSAASLYGSSLETLSLLLSTFSMELHDKFDEISQKIKESLTACDEIVCRSAMVSVENLVSALVKLSLSPGNVIEWLVDISQGLDEVDSLSQLWETIAVCIFRGGRETVTHKLVEKLCAALEVSQSIYARRKGKGILHESLVEPLLKTVEQIVLTLKSAEVSLDRVYTAVVAVSRTYPRAIQTMAVMSHFGIGDVDMVIEKVIKELSSKRAKFALSALPFLFEVGHEKLNGCLRNITQTIRKVVNSSDIDVIEDAARVWCMLVAEFGFDMESDISQPLMDSLVADVNDYQLRFYARFARVRYQATNEADEIVTMVAVSVLASDQSVVEFIEPTDYEVMKNIVLNTPQEEREEILRWRSSDIAKMNAKISQ